MLDEASLCAFIFAYRSRTAFASGEANGTTVHTCVSIVLCHLLLCLFVVEASVLQREANFSPLLLRRQFSRHSRQIYFSFLSLVYAWTAWFLFLFLFFFSGTGFFSLFKLTFFQSHRRFTPITTAVPVVPVECLNVGFKCFENI